MCSILTQRRKGAKGMIHLASLRLGVFASWRSLYRQGSGKVMIEQLQVNTEPVVCIHELAPTPAPAPQRLNNTGVVAYHQPPMLGLCALQLKRRAQNLQTRQDRCRFWASPNDYLM
jgi:hypothetical protein